MKKSIFSSGLGKIRLILYINIYICTNVINGVSSVSTSGVSTPPNHPDKQILIGIRTQQGGVDKIPSLSRTMAELGTRIKKKIGDSFFFSNSVKRVGQAGKKPAVKPWNTNEKRSLDTPSTKFRPHQPDITSELRGGKLTLPVVEIGDDRATEVARSPQPKPTPMANKINPYTNGVYKSFPPGIDPYDGFIKYAAENLDSPMGNMVDYHSLEHYYGPQHPLSPYHKPKEGPYADNFSYMGGNEVETGSAPPPPPPPSQGRGGPSHGFRPHHSGSPTGNPHSYPVNSQEHGVDMFHASSPGQPKLKPRPTMHSELDEEFERRPPPPEPPHSSPYGKRPPNGPPHIPPYNELSDGDEDEHNPPPPPDLQVFNEGPPPELLNPRPGSSPSGPSHEDSHEPPQPIQDNAENLDGGDDAIWGILDLAEMLEKGQIPGANKASNTASGNPTQSSDRVVIPIFNRPPPPRLSENPQEDQGSPFSSRPHGNKYDDYDDDHGDPSGDFPDETIRPSSFGHSNRPMESHESSNDYSY